MDHPFGTQMQRCLAGRQHAKIRTPLEQLADGDCRPDHVLEVVEDQKEVVIPDPAGHRIEHVLAGWEGNSETARQLRHDEAGVGEGAQLDHGGRSAVKVAVSLQHLEREASLADSGAPRESHQAMWSGHEGNHDRKIRFAADHLSRRAERRANSDRIRHAPKPTGSAGRVRLDDSLRCHPVNRRHHAARSRRGWANTPREIRVTIVIEPSQED